MIMVVIDPATNTPNIMHRLSDKIAELHQRRADEACDPCIGGWGCGFFSFSCFLLYFFPFSISFFLLFFFFFIFIILFFFYLFFLFSFLVSFSLFVSIFNLFSIFIFFYFLFLFFFIFFPC
jgi:hypothetical protein